MSSLAAERALKLFGSEVNCAQSVYAGCATEEADRQRRLAVAAAFGGGVARAGEICGALTGALMAMGDARQEEIEADPVGARGDLYADARLLMEEFRQAHGAIRCKELHGCDLSTAEGKTAFEARGLHASFCSGLVAWAAERAGRQRD